jgi:hypothetical protein
VDTPGLLPSLPSPPIIRDSVPEEIQERVVFHEPVANETITDTVQMAVVAPRVRRVSWPMPSSSPSSISEGILRRPTMTMLFALLVQMAVVAVREELNNTSNKANNIVIVGRRSIPSEISSPSSISEGILRRPTMTMLFALLDVLLSSSRTARHWP